MFFLYFSVFSNGKMMLNKKMTEEKMMEFLKEGADLLKPLVIRSVKKDVSVENRYRPDALIEADIPGEKGTFSFAVEVKASNTPLVIKQAVFEIKPLASYGKTVPLIFVPYLSSERLGELEAEGVSGVDLCGNGVIIVPGRVYVFRSGQPNLYPESRPLNNPYRGRSALVARLLLIRQQFDSLKSLQKDLAAAGEIMAISQVSKAVQALADDLVVTKTKGTIKLTDPSKLLDMLASEWKKPVMGSQQTLRLKNGVNSLSALSGDPMLKWAVSGASSVSKYAVFSESGPLMVAVTDMEAALKQIEWSPEPVKNFADVILFETDDAGFFFVSNMDAAGIRWVDMIQSYIELSNGDARQKEAAGDIREQIMRGMKI